MNVDKKIFVVLGMPRSGTSVITRGLQALGIDLGERLTPPDFTWNPTGFWEDQDISNKINCGILYALNYPWESISLVDKNAQLQLTDLKNEAMTILNTRLQTSKAWGFKDPRTAKVIPFWQMVFREMSLQDNYVIALRHPLSAARSYQKLRHFDIEIGLMLWMMHLFPAIEETHGKNRILVSFENMLNYPIQELQRIQLYFKLTNIESVNISEYTNNFLNPNLAHYPIKSQDYAVQLFPLCDKMYHLLQKVATDTIKFETEEFEDEWKIIRAEFEAQYPLFLYFDQMIKRQRSYEKHKRSLERSLIWKMVYPLRIIDETLRGYRKKFREKRRFKKSLAL